MSGLETVPCTTCGESTTSTVTKRCDRCWELENRIDNYLARGGDKARSLVIAALKHNDPKRDPARPRASGIAASMTIEEARLPRKVVQLIATGNHLFCMCDDGTAWRWINDLPVGWRLLPKPGLPPLSENDEPSPEPRIG